MPQPAESTSNEQDHSELMALLFSEGVLRRQPHQARSTARILNILDAANRICAQDGIPAVNTAAIAEATGLPIGTVYQFFENREVIIRGVVLRVNYETTILIEALMDESASENWLTHGPEVWDRYMDIFLEQKDLVETVRTVGHLQAYRDASRNRIGKAADMFVRHLEQAGIEPTPRRKEVALFCLQMSNFFRHLVVAETDPKKQRFLRDQMIIMIKGYVMPAMLRA